MGCKILTILALFIVLALLWLSSDRLALFVANSLARLDNYHVRKNIGYGKHQNHRLDVYTPDQSVNASQSKPVVIFFYGGCWGACQSYDKGDYAFVAQAFSSLGYITVVPDYRHYPEFLFEDIMADTISVVHWVENNIADFDGDARRIVLAGHSSGAHLAAMLTLDESRLPVSSRINIAGFVGLAGPYDFYPFTENYQPTLFGPEENYPRSQPVNFMTGKKPAMLLLYGNNDTRVKPVNIESLTIAAMDAGSEVESHRYDGIDHAGILAALSRPLRDKRPVMSDIARFTDMVLNCN